MPSSLSRRAVRLHERTRRAWEAAWDRWVDAYLEALPDGMVNQLAEGDASRTEGRPEDTAFLRAFLDAHGWTEAHEAAWEPWHDALNASIGRTNACDLTFWPVHIPRPPDAPPQLLPALYEAYEAAPDAPPTGGSLSQRDLYASILTVLLYACAVRTLYGEPMPQRPLPPGSYRIPGSNVVVRIVRPYVPPSEADEG